MALARLCRQFPGGFLLPGILLSFLIAVPRLLASDGDPATLKQLARKGFDSETIGAFLQSNAPGILTAFAAGPAIRVSDLQMSFKLRRTETLDAEYLMMNRTPEAIDVSLMSFLDYRRVDFRLGDHRLLVHRLHLKAGEWMSWPFHLENIPQGAHDFLVLGVVSDSKGHSSTNSFYPLLFHRANIFVEGDVLPSVRCRVLEEADALGGAVETEPVDVESASTVRAPIASDRSVRVRLDNSRDVPISLVALLISRDDDLRHLSLRSEARSPCFTLAPQSTYEPLLKLPATWVHDDVLVISVENPFTRLEPETGVVARVPASVRAFYRVPTRN
jgi:hypothetical protein